MLHAVEADAYCRAFNFPVNLSFGPMIGAIAAGNTVVLKTAEQTPLSGLYACTLVEKAGIPAGVINVLSGFGKTAGAAIRRAMCANGDVLFLL